MDYLTVYFAISPIPGSRFQQEGRENVMIAAVLPCSVCRGHIGCSAFELRISHDLKEEIPTTLLDAELAYFPRIITCALVYEPTMNLPGF